MDQTGKNHGNHCQTEKLEKKHGTNWEKKNIAASLLCFEEEHWDVPKISRSQPVLEPVVSHHQAQGSCEELAAGLILRFKPMVFFPDLIPEISVNV